MTPESSSSTDSRLSGRWVIAGLMAVLLLWGAYLSRGVFLQQRSVLQGAVVLVCVLGFLIFWGLMLVSQSRSAPSKYSRASLAGFVCGLVSLLLVTPVSFAVQLDSIQLQLDLLQPGKPLLVSAFFVGLCVLLSIIGLSRPQPQVGKNLGYCALPLAIAWGCLAFYIVSR